MKKLPLRKKDHAWRCIKNFRRYRTNKAGKSIWDQRGPHTPNQLIPPCTRRQNAECHRLMEQGGMARHVELVDPGLLRTFQKSLRVTSLLWNLRHFEEKQRGSGEDLPTVVVTSDGAMVVWNGNHRSTVGLLLGLGRIKARVFRARKTREKPARRRGKKDRGHCSGQLGIPLAALFDGD